MAAAVDMGLSSVVSFAVLQVLRLTGFNGSLIWFFVICFIVFEFRDIIGKRSVGKRIFGLSVVSLSGDDPSVSPLRLLLRNSTDFIFPLVLFQICKYNEKNGDKLAKTCVCTNQSNSQKNENKIIDRYGLKWIIVIVAAILFYLSYFFTGYSYLKNTEAYKSAVEYLHTNGCCEETTECELKAGNVFGRKAGFDILVGDDHYDIMLDCVNDDWEITFCECRDSGR